MSVHWGGRGPGHKSRWPSSASGGTLPPFAFPSGAMLTGMGLSHLVPYLGYYPFANIMWNGSIWEHRTGSGAYTQEWGEVTAAVQTDVFRTKLIESRYSSIPAGTYTVLNPDGLEIAVGAYTDETLAAYTTATQFTFTYANDRHICIHVKGSVTNNNGPIQVIMPGRLSAFQAGDYWNPDFLTFITGLKVSCLRFMDWLVNNTDISETPADRVPDFPILLRAPCTRQAAKVSDRLVVDLCNRLNINPWLNMPVRADDDYIDTTAAYYAANLNPGLRAYIEYGNETWNSAGGFADSRSWVQHLFNTPYEATVNVGQNGWTRTAHGLTTGTLIAQYFHRNNYIKKDDIPHYPNGFGLVWYVDVIDANNFRIHEWTGTEGAPVIGALIPPGALTNMVYKKHASDPGVVNVDTNEGVRSKQIWDRWDAIISRNRCIHILPTQLVGGSLTTARLAPTGVRAATDAVAVAAYYAGDWWVSAVDISSGQVVPKAWSRQGGVLGGSQIAARLAVYASGSTPTMAEVLAGTGTGYVGHRDVNIASTDLNSWTSGSAITGLTNGTGYVFKTVFTGEDGYKFMFGGTFTASATPSTVAFYDDDEAMAMRARRNTREFLIAKSIDQMVICDGIPLIAYECGSDFFANNVSIPEVIAWRTAWTQTAKAGDVFGHLYTSHAALGLKMMNQYYDINAVPGVFNIAESFTDTSDPRYLKFFGFDGQVTQGTTLVVGDMNPATIATEPSYPFTVHTFPDATLTYQIYNGDVNGNFAIVGNQLRMINGYGVNWASPTPRNLTIEAANSVSTDYFKADFFTGAAWYEADAVFAWDSITDSDPAQIDPAFGSALALSGTAATVASGLWDMGDTAAYINNTGLLANVVGTKPILLIAVLDRDNHSAQYRTVIDFGGSSRFGFTFSDFNRLHASVTVTGTNLACDMTAMTAGQTRVWWAFYDADPVTPKLHAGYNTTEQGTGVAINLAAASYTRNIGIGSSSQGGNKSNMKHGSVQVINRAGMTLTDVLTVIVPKMMTKHGI